RASYQFAIALWEGFANVRFGSEADMCGAIRHVRFTPNSNRESGFPKTVMSASPESGHVRCTSRCPLWAKSGHVQCTRSCPLWSRKRPQKRTLSHFKMKLFGARDAILDHHLPVRDP